MLDPYRPVPGWPNWATIVVTLMIEPLPRAAIAGASSATRKNGTFTFTPYTPSKSASVCEAVGPNGKMPAG